MSYVYICEQGAVVGVEENRLQVKYKDGMVKTLPIEPLESIELFGRIQVSTACMTECLKRGITLGFFSTTGAYYGRLSSTNHVHVERQRLQASMSPEFCLGLSKRLVSGKISNQMVMVRRYNRYKEMDLEEYLKAMKRNLEKIEQCSEIDELMGYEGAAARIYFSCLGKLIDREFYFEGRNRRPPKDPFNSLISLGYAILLNEIYGKIEAKGLNPYFGVLHQDREKHPTLASDFMEEWRAVLIDSLAMSLLNGHELKEGDFYKGENGGIFLEKDAFKLYLDRLEKKLRTDQKYLNYVDYPTSFRRAIELQVNQFVKALEEEDYNLYEPIFIR